MSGNITNRTLAIMQRLRESLSILLDIRLSDITPEATISDLGIDSIMSHEVARELGKQFGMVLSGEDLIELDDMESLCKRLASSRCTSPRTSSRNSSRTSTRSSSRTSSCASSRSSSTMLVKRLPQSGSDELIQPLVLTGSVLDSGVCEVAAQCMVQSRANYDSAVQEAGFSGFFEDVYPLQKELVLAYIVEAFRDLGCDLANQSAGEEISTIRYNPRYAKVVHQYFGVLEEAGLIARYRNSWLRTTSSFEQAPSDVLLAQLVQLYPRYAAEHMLCNITASRLAACLTGESDPVELLDAEDSTHNLQEQYYANSPYLKAGASFLSQYLVDVMSKSDLDRPLRILEIGAGAGGTTQHVLRNLVATGLRFEYTFSDVSASLVAAGQKKFSQYEFVQYKIIDVEKPTQPSLEGQFDIVFSSNSVHATTNVVKATRNIRGMLRENGVLCLLEMMQKLPWFDLVFGLLERWWMFEDGRKYALVDEGYWDQCLSSAGYRWMDHSRGESRESGLLRLLVASPSAKLSPVYSFTGNSTAKPLPWKETITYKQVGDLALEADLYYPRETQSGTSAPRPIALMIHGGGHVMLCRNDIRPQQTKCLIKAGFLPISIDYRLCPEVNVLEGPITDVRDAYVWIRKVLASVARERPDVKVDTSRVVVTGWSSGGHLAMTLGWTPAQCDVAPPEAILAFYCQTDYEDTFWTQPNIPRGSEDAAKEYSYLPLTHLREGISESPIVAYNIPPEHRSLSGWMSPKNPRSRLALWANWTGKQRELLLQGLHADESTEDFAEIDVEQINAISPMAQIKEGSYTTPTFLIHGTEDDLIPWQQTKSTFEALASREVDADCRIVQGAGHVFDAVAGWQDDFERCKAVWDGYDFLKKHVN